MENFDFHRKTLLLFGRDRENEVGSLVKYEGGRRVECLYTEDIPFRDSLLERVRRSLDRAGLECYEFCVSRGDPEIGDIRRAIEECRENRVDFIMAIGGSALIDAAKAVAAGAVYNGDVLDFFTGRREPVKTLGTGCIVICPDTGAETSPACEITLSEEGSRRCRLIKSSYALLPRFAVLNPDLSLNMSAHAVICSCMDMLAGIMGSYFTNTQSVCFTDEMCEGVLRSLVRLMPELLRKPADYDVWANLMLCGTVSQHGICSLGRETDAACVFLEHELSSIYPCNRGEALAVLLPAWLTFCLGHNVMRAAQFAVKVFGISMNFDEPMSTAKEGVTALRAFLSSLDMPQNFAEMGLHRVDVHRIIASMNFKQGDTVGSYVKMSAEDCEIVYTIANAYRR